MWTIFKAPFRQIFSSNSSVQVSLSPMSLWASNLYHNLWLKSFIVLVPVLSEGEANKKRSDQVKDLNNFQVY